MNRELGKHIDAVCNAIGDTRAALGKPDRSGYVYSDTTKDKVVKQKRTGASSCSVAFESYVVHVPKKNTDPQDFLHIPVNKIVFTPLVVSEVCPPFSISIVQRGGTVHFSSNGKSYFTMEAVVKEFGRYAGVEALLACIQQFIQSF